MKCDVSQPSRWGTEKRWSNDLVALPAVAMPTTATTTQNRMTMRWWDRTQRVRADMSHHHSGDHVSTCVHLTSALVALRQSGAVALELDEQVVLERDALGAVLEVAEHRLEAAHRLGRPLARCLGELERRRFGLGLGHDAMHQADPPGLLGAHQPAGEDQLLRAREADERHEARR